MRRIQIENGSITLETSIILPLFIIVFLFVNGLFAIVSVQNQMTHVLVQSAKSLSLDSYLLENIESAGEEKTKFWGSFTDMVLDFVRLDTDLYFSSILDWYNSPDGNPEVARKRFVGSKSNKADIMFNMEPMGTVEDGLQFVVYDHITGEIVSTPGYN